MARVRDADEGEDRVTALRRAMFSAGTAIEEGKMDRARAILGRALEADIALSAPVDWLEIPDPEED